MFRIARQFKPDILIGTDIVITHIGRLLKIPAIILNEDDELAVPLLANYGFRYSSCVLSPRICCFDRYQSKKIEYDGYHELTYLHSKYFEPDPKKVAKLKTENKKYFILRFAELTAHHDDGISGITTEIAQNLIEKLQREGRVYVTSERRLKPQFEKYRIQINPLDMHHALYFAQMYIGDSQTMAAEAAVLGTPSIRFNDFVGKLGYLEELEHKYGLTYGIKTSEPEKLYAKIEELLCTPNLKDEWQKRRQKMLSEKIDVTAFMVWFIENYPESAKVMRENPDYQFRFMNNGLPKHRSEAIVTS